MPLFTVTRTAVALNTSNDTLTIVASANNPLRIVMSDVKGVDIVSAKNEVALQRSTGGTTGGGAITPEKLCSTDPAANFSVFTSWANQPTLSGGPLWRFTPNANGGIDKFTALPGAEMKVPRSGQISIRSVSGTGNVVCDLLIEELDG